MSSVPDFWSSHKREGKEPLADADWLGAFGECWPTLLALLRGPRSERSSLQLPGGSVMLFRDGDVLKVRVSLGKGRDSAFTTWSDPTQDNLLDFVEGLLAAGKLEFRSK